MSECVYVIQSSANCSKIGISKRPLTRLSHLRIEFKEDKLNIAFAGEVERRSIALHIEHRAHDILWNQRMRGDWFNVSASDATTAVMRAAEELGYTILPTEQKEQCAAAGDASSIRMSDELVAQIDAWRREQEDIPTRSEAIRRLVDQALKVKR